MTPVILTHTELFLRILPYCSTFYGRPME